MHPILIDLGEVRLPLLGATHLFLPTYGLLFATGALVAWTWFVRRARSIGVADDLAFNLGFYSLLAGLAGAKLLLIVIDLPLYLRNPAEILGVVRAAGVLMGGVLAGAGTFVWYARRHELPLARLTDAVVAPVALAQGIGRLGCFSAGCCYGVPTHADHPFAITFTAPAASAQTGVPLHVPLIATQPIQAVHDLALAAVLAWLWRRRLPAGMTTAAYLVLYGIGRGTIEIWRGDRGRGLYFGDTVSTSQLLAVATVALGIAVAWRARARGTDA